MRLHIAVTVLTITLLNVGGVMAEDPFVRPPEKRTWQPVEDTVFLQEMRQVIPSEQPIASIALSGTDLFLVIQGTLHQLRDNTIVPVEGGPQSIRELQAPDGEVWALSDAGLYRREGAAWTKVDDRVFTDLCLHAGKVHGASEGHVYRFEAGTWVSIEPEGGYRSTNLTFLMEDGTQVLPAPVTWGRLQRIESFAETVYGMRHGTLMLFDGEAIDETVADWGMLPSPVTRDMLRLSNRLYIATDRGLAVLRGMHMTTLRGTDGLPFEDTTCLALGFANDLWIGTTRGAIRYVDGQFQYFGADRWLPGDHVNAIVAGDRVVYVATNAGLGIIHYQPTTLAEKAAWFERWLEDYGHKRMGFVHKLHWSDAEQGWLREISDNDGLNTAHYLAAMSFKYAVTGDERAREEAVNTFEAMAWLEEITTVRGFVARAIWSVQGDRGEKARHGSGGLPAKWYPTECGLWEWKGDTSSDEINGHFYGVSVFHDLAARGAEKERAAEHLSRIMDHILENGWLLRDMDGQPTRWGRWDPAYLKRPYGIYARGLNGMQAQKYAITTYALTGNPKYAEALQQLLDWGYHRHTVRQKLTFPPNYIVPWEDHLAFISFYALMRYTQDPMLRSIYARSLERSWEIRRREKVAWYNFVYGAATGNDPELEAAMDYLRALPTDSTVYTFVNSFRHDLDPRPGYVPYGGGTRGMSPRETSPPRGHRSVLAHDGFSGGRSIVEPTAFLEEYWMGRYMGFITAPTEAVPPLRAPGPPTDAVRGALPYSGPPRPAGIIPGR